MSEALVISLTVVIDSDLARGPEVAAAVTRALSAAAGELLKEGVGTTLSLTPTSNGNGTGDDVS